MTLANSSITFPMLLNINWALIFNVDMNMVGQSPCLNQVYIKFCNLLKTSANHRITNSWKCSLLQLLNTCQTHKKIGTHVSHTLLHTNIINYMQWYSYCKLGYKNKSFESYGTYLRTWCSWGTSSTIKQLGLHSSCAWCVCACKCSNHVILNFLLFGGRWLPMQFRMPFF